MAKGKQTCKILKEIRKQIAAENDIEFVTSECTYKGDCKGTCPKCEAEVRYLERELEKRQRMGKAAVFAGMSLGTLFAATSCDHPIPRPTEGEPCVPDSTEMQNSVDTISNDTLLLEGDVLDTLVYGKSACKDDEIIEMEGRVEYDLPADSSYVFEPEEDENRPGVYIVVEQMPEFPGGDRALMDFVKDNIQYPADARKRGIQGRVFANFIVEPDGSLSDIKILLGIGGGCDEEAIRVIESMPKFNPGMQNGEAVRVSYTIPVFFRLE